MDCLEFRRLLGSEPHVVRSAARMYQQERNAEADPLLLYDIAVARALLKEDEA